MSTRDAEREYLDRHPTLRYFAMNLVAIEAELYGSGVAVARMRSRVMRWIANGAAAPPLDEGPVA